MGTFGGLGPEPVNITYCILRIGSCVRCSKAGIAAFQGLLLLLLCPACLTAQRYRDRA